MILERASLVRVIALNIACAAKKVTVIFLQASKMRLNLVEIAKNVAAKFIRESANRLSPKLQVNRQSEPLR